MMNKVGFTELIIAAFDKEIIKKLVFSRPVSSEVSKISCRVCSHRRGKVLAMEFFLPGNTVSHRNLVREELTDTLSELLTNYRQANLITVIGDAEYKVGKDGGVVVLGGDTLLRKLCECDGDFESAIESLDRKKQYILSGNEEFLTKLGISSRDGRVHDKKQGKFRQINRFLEHIEEIYPRLPDKDELKIYDLCCGKSYLSFAVYYYLTEVKKRTVYLYGADLKRDVINWCSALAQELAYTGMHFEVGDISKIDFGDSPDMVISLHACDIATDIVLDTAVRLGAGIILSTPCCHRYLNGKVVCDELKFVTDYPHISNKLSEAITDSLRLLRLRANGYSVSALELTDPENTPKNTLLRAVKNERMTKAETESARVEYEGALRFLLGDKSSEYLSEIRGS